MSGAERESEQASPKILEIYSGGLFPKAPVDLAREIFILPRTHEEWINSMNSFGTNWITPELLRLANRVIREQPNGVVIMPSSLEDNLPAVSALLAATEIEATCPIALSIEEREIIKGDALLDSQGITMPTGRKVDEETRKVQVAIGEALNQADAFYTKWQNLINQAANGNQQAVRCLAGGIWGHYYATFKNPKTIAGWEEIFFEDPVDSQFLKIISSQGSRFNLWAIENMIKEGDIISPETFVQALKRIVEEILNDPKKELVNKTIAGEYRDLQTTLHRVLVYTPIGQVLSQRNQVLAAKAAETGNLGTALQICLESQPHKDIKYDPEQGVLVVTSKRGLSGAIIVIQELLSSVAKSSAHNITCKLTGEITMRTEGNLVPYDDLLSKAKGIKLDSATRTRFRSITQEGRGVAWLWGTSGSGKTTSAAIVARSVRETDEKTAIVRPPSEPTVDDIIKAIHEATAEIAQGKPTLLGIDDIHIPLKEITPGQTHALQRALDLANTILDKTEVAGGIIITGEYPPETHALGMPHRAVAIEMSLWKGDPERDRKLLTEVWETAGRKVAAEFINPVLEVVHAYIQQAGERRRHLTASFLKYEVGLACTRLEESQESETVIGDLREEMRNQIAIAEGERTESMASMLQKEVEAHGTKLKNMEELLSTTRAEIVTKQDKLTAEIESLRAEIGKLEGLSGAFEGLQKRLELLGAEVELLAIQLQEGVAKKEPAAKPGEPDLTERAVNLFG